MDLRSICWTQAAKQNQELGQVTHGEGGSVARRSAQSFPCLECFRTREAAGRGAGAGGGIPETGGICPKQRGDLRGKSGGFGVKGPGKGPDPKSLRAAERREANANQNLQKVA